MELCIANLQSSFMDEREQEESFESAGKNVELFLCHAKAWDIPRMYLMTILGSSHQVGFVRKDRGCSEHIPRTVGTGSRECTNSNTDGCCSALPPLCCCS